MQIPLSKMKKASEKISPLSSLEAKHRVRKFENIVKPSRNISTSESKVTTWKRTSKRVAQTIVKSDSLATTETTM
jgi:hypothetical protein